MIASAVYLLCSGTSVVCAGMLLANFRRSRMRLLFWSAVFFLAFAFSNVVLFVDIVLVPRMDLYLLRTLPALAGACLLAWGLIWEST